MGSVRGVEVEVEWNKKKASQAMFGCLVGPSSAIFLLEMGLNALLF